MMRADQTARVRLGRSQHLVRLGKDVSLDPAALTSYSRSAPTATDHDLLWVAGVVAFADRTVPRRIARDGWARRFEIDLPVADPARWHGASNALASCLAWVTGDEWRFSFRERRREWFRIALPPTCAPADVVLPFSGGLDGFLTAELARRNGRTPLLVTARTSALVRDAAAATAPELAGRERTVGLPIRLAVGRHADETFRTRTFLFGSAAAVAARVASVDAIIVAENGQGSIGASLVPFGAEFPYRTTHPGFTRRLMSLLQTLGYTVTYEHPTLWQTKGEMLSEALRVGSADGWERTSSCSRNMPRAKGAEAKTACGICGNCMLRRVSVHAAGAIDSTRYYWSLRGRSLDESVRDGAGVVTTETDVAYAARSVLSMDAFANLSDDEPSFRRGVGQVSEALGIADDDARRRQRRLRDAHRDEWRMFLRSLPRSSWVHGYTDGRYVGP